jgi:hypothetical protein
MKKLPTRIHNILMSTKIYTPLYVYLKDGIYINYGPYKGLSLTDIWNNNSEVAERFIDNLLDSEIPYKLRFETSEVYKDLKNNYPFYEEGK